MVLEAIGVGAMDFFSKKVLFHIFGEQKKKIKWLLSNYMHVSEFKNRMKLLIFDCYMYVLEIETVAKFVWIKCHWIVKHSDQNLKSPI